MAVLVGSDDGAAGPPQVSSPVNRPSQKYFQPLQESDDSDDAFDREDQLARASRVQTPPDEPRAMMSAESGGPLAEVMGGVLTTVLVLVLNVTYAGVVMGGNTAFQPYLSHGISMCLACTAISNLWLLLARRNMPFITVADSFMSVLFATTADNIVAATRGEDGADAANLGTLAVAMFFCSLLLGVGYLAVGYARVCNVVQFVPTPVMAGYQASIGYLLLDSASTLASGCSLLHPTCFLHDARTNVTQLVLASALGVSLHVATQKTEGVTRTMIMPTLLVLTSIAFQLFKGLAPPEVDLTNWSLAIPETGQSVFTLPRDLDLSHVQWSLAAREALLASVTAFVPNLLGKLLQFSALEGLFDMDIDYNMEICHAGYSQLVSAPAAMIPTVTYLGMIVAHDMGARSFLPPAMVIGGSTLLVFSGSYIVSLVPKAMFAALLVTSGLNLLSDNLKSAYNDLMRKEFALVVLHIGLTAALGMLSAVVLGMLFTAGIFVVQYSSHSGVLQSATSLLERSKVARTIAEQDILEQYGATVLVIHLHGMIFFGSANSVVEEIKAHLATLAELSLPLRFVLLDFDRCSAIDSSAVNVLFQTRRLTKDAGLIFACAGTDVLAMLNRGKGVSSQGHASSSRPSGTEDSSNERNFEHFTTLDLALEQCENRLLQRYMYEHGGAINPPSPMMLKPHAMFGVAPSWLDHDGHDVHLRTIDERNPMADDRPYTLSNPSSEPDEQRVGRNSAEALPSSAQGPSGAAPAALGADGDGARLLRKHKQRHKRVDRRSASERLPNPFVGSPHHLAVLNASSQKHPQEFRDRPGPLNGSTSSPNHSAEAGMLNGGQPSGDGSDGSSDSSQSGGGVGTIYSPEQARAELRPDHLDKMRDRFTEAMRASYGAKELDELFDHMDIMLIPPNQTVLSSHAVPEEPHLYILDRGHISAYATLGGDIGADAEALGGQSENVNLAKGEQSNPRHRLAKYGAGAILGVATFVTPDDMPGLNIMPTAAISDTYCQLLRLSRSRCDDLERLKPALIFRLYRLLVLISERRLQDHRMRVVASEAFKINVRPSTNFQRMLVGSSTLPPSIAPNDQIVQIDPKSRPATIAFSRSSDQLLPIAPGTALSAQMGAMPPAGAPSSAEGERTSRGLSATDGGSSDERTAGSGGGGGGYGSLSITVGNGGSGGSGHHRSGSHGDGAPILSALRREEANNTAVQMGACASGPPSASDVGASILGVEDGALASPPSSTPTPERRTDAFVGPALNLFTAAGTKDWADAGIPPSQSFPGREPLPVASLQSFQSAMLAEVSAARDEEGVGDSPREHEGEIALIHDPKAAVTEKEQDSWLWPKRPDPG